MRTRLLSLSLLAAAALSAPAALAEPPFAFARTPGQLPKDVIPKYYAVTLDPDPEKLTIDGSEVIDIEVAKPTRTIVLNALDMEVPRASVDGKPVAVRVDNQQQTVTVTLAEPLAAGTHKLALDFKGKIGQTPEGLFYVRYQAPDGSKKLMFGTQMEPTDARRMFPSWDEPVFRSRFQLSVKLPEKFEGVSNMPVESEQKLEGGRKLLRFAPTPAMASYLVVLCAGEFDAVEDVVAGVKIRVVTTRGKEQNGRYALASLKALLPYYNDYFGQKYPLPKLDMIALPGGFGGAMENWGGITYNESALLFDPERSSQVTRERVHNIIAHEVAHQWFGDLVTMAWWDNLWLNEGFASWMASKATDHFNPGWQFWQRQDASKQTAMDIDARRTTHPIQQPVKEPAEAAAAFDAITYQKGQAVIRMIESYLGEVAFRDGIRSYMDAHKLSNTTTADLWNALGQASGKPVAEIAASWTEQPGLPVVQVRQECAPGGKRFLALAQERFTINDPQAKPQLWKIPLTWAPVGSQKIETTLLVSPSTRVAAGACSDAPVKINVGNTGYYRVQYDPTLARQLAERFDRLPADDRLNLLSDTWALVEAGRASARDYLALAERVRPDDTLAVWDQVIDTVRELDLLQRDQPGRPTFQESARRLLKPLYARLGWEAKPGEAETDALLRARVLQALGTYQDQQVIDEARRRFAAFLTSPASLPGNLRPPVTRIVGRWADQKTYDQLHELGRKTASTEEQRLFYAAMASALDPKLAAQTLDLALTDELEPGIASALVSQVATIGEQPNLAWRFLQKHPKELLGKQAFFSRYRYVGTVTGLFKDADHARELVEFARANLPADALPEIDKAAERIEAREQIARKALPQVKAWACNQGISQTQARFCVDVR
jgi:aminopeptidase N